MSRLRYLTSGESHGEMLVGILDGIPAGLSLVAERDIDPILQERQKGYGRGRRQKIENDRAEIVSGVRFGVTTGAPIAVIVRNKDWKNWEERMSVAAGGPDSKPVTIPRPGHADFAGGIKYGHESDLRNVLERSSARETTMRTAIGAIANRLLAELGIESISYVTAIGSVTASSRDPFTSREVIGNSKVRCSDVAAELRMIEAIDRAKSTGDTLGGTVECQFTGMPIGVGSHVQWDKKLDGIVAQAVMSTQAVKSVEIGLGGEAATLHGSDVHDEFAIRDGAITRTRNNAGGIEGGMSNGEAIVVRAHMKPISTLMSPLQSVDLATGAAANAHIERSDVCAVPALSVIVEQVIALALAAEILETFGGDTMAELSRRIGRRRSRSKINTAPIT